MLQSLSFFAKIVIAAVALTLAAGSFAAAQQRGGRQGAPPFDAEKYIADLTGAIELSDEQTADIKGIMEQAGQRAQGQGQRRRGRGGMFGMMNRVNEAIEKVLSEEQVEIFREFNFNRAVDGSIARYIEALELTEEQQVKVRVIVAEDMKAMTEMRGRMSQGGGGQGGDRQAMMEQFRARRQAVNDKITAILNDDQKAAFEQMNQRRGRRGQ